MVRDGLALEYETPAPRRSGWRPPVALWEDAGRWLSIAFAVVIAMTAIYVVAAFVLRPRVGTFVPHAVTPLNGQWTSIAAAMAIERHLSMGDRGIFDDEELASFLRAAGGDIFDISAIGSPPPANGLTIDPLIDAIDRQIRVARAGDPTTPPLPRDNYFSWRGPLIQTLLTPRGTIFIGKQFVCFVPKSGRWHLRCVDNGAFGTAVVYADLPKQGWTFETSFNTMGSGMGLSRPVKGRLVSPVAYALIWASLIVSAIAAILLRSPVADDDRAAAGRRRWRLVAMPIVAVAACALAMFAHAAVAGSDDAFWFIAARPSRPALRWNTVNHMAWLVVITTAGAAYAILSLWLRPASPPEALSSRPPSV